MDTYEVTVTRDSDLWVAIVHGLPPNTVGAIDAEHFATLQEDVPDVIAGLVDADPNDVAIRWRYEINGQDVTDQFQRFLHAKETIERDRAEVYSARMELVRTLTDQGLSRRATGDAIGLSGQRVQQIVDA